MMILTDTLLDSQPSGMLAAPLNVDVATYLRNFDLPVPGAKLAHIGVVARAVIGTLVNQAERPWCLISDLAALFATSRQTIYTIGARLQEGVLVRPNGRRRVETGSPAAATPAPYPTLSVTPTRVQRTVLSNLLPGGMTIRPQQACLQTALDTTRSVGWISELLLEAGARAGRKLDALNLSALGSVVTARDELYFADQVFMLHVEPQHLVLVSGYVEEHCDSETWSVALQLDHHTRGLQLRGLAEDGAPMYPASLEQAALTLPVQKDVWHIESNAEQAVRDVERQALKALTQAEKLLDQIVADAAHDDAERLAQWGAADARAAELVELSAQVRQLRGHLCDALEVVDWRSGEIRDREINAWLLQEVITELQTLEHPRVRKLVTYLKNQQPQMLTFLDWLQAPLHAWQQQLAQYLPDPVEQQFFQATVAQTWRLQRAVANGHTAFRAAAEFATALQTELVADDPRAQHLAQALHAILEGVVRTSSAVEAVNSVLRPYLTVKRSFQSRATAQAWLNLFCLWFNMHPLLRSKRRHGSQPMSPYQYAGIKVYTEDGRETLDWLEALGYPPDN
jgi:hypothetical protein